MRAKVSKKKVSYLCRRNKNKDYFAVCFFKAIKYWETAIEKGLMLAQRERDSGSPTKFAFSSNGYKPVRWSWNQEGIDSIMSEFLNLENVLLSASGSFRA